MAVAVHTVRKLRRGLVALAIALPILYVLFAVVVILQDHQSTMEQAGSDMRNIAATLNEHALRTFGEADILLRTAIAEIERRKLTLSPADERSMHEILDDIDDAALAASLNVVDSDGWMRASGSAYPLEPVDSRDHEYYVYLSTHPERDMHIGRSIYSRASGKWTVPVARRIENPDGSLKMIVNFSVDTGYFDHFYRTLDLGDSSRLLLLRRDGWVIVETPLLTDVMDHNVGDTKLFRVLQRVLSGVYHAERSMVEGGARLIGYASVAQSPLVAVASVAHDEVLKPWVRRSWQIAGIGAVSTLLLLGLLRFLWLRLADLEVTQTSLARRNTELEVTQTSLARRNAELDAAHNRFLELVDGIDGVVWEAVLPEFRFTYVSGNAEAISGYSAQEWVDDPNFWRDRLQAATDGKPAEPVLALGGPGLIKPLEHRVLAPDGREIWLRSNIMLAGSSKGKLQVRGITVDITQQKQAELQLFQAVHVDPLTKLPNRRALIERTGHALALAQCNHTAVAIILIDVDKFSTLNDSLGHERGDELLVQIAARLQGRIGATDMLARMGGDEFAIVVEDVDRVALKAEHLAERISEALAYKMPSGDRELYLTVSMGIAVYPQDGFDCPALLRNADTALYRAKAAGRNGWQFFDSSMARQVEHRMDLEVALREAIDQEQFRLYYQPQHALHDGNIVGAEALLRWERPGIGMVPPQEFISVAEESGFIVALGTWVLRAACSQAAAWSMAGLPLRIAVNVSVVQLQEADFVDQVRRALVQSGLPPHRLELEITEGAAVSNILGTIEKMHDIKAMGVELAVDDFGTGYSSLSYLKQMPVDRLKVDQSFVHDIPHNTDDCAIVRAILAMAANLNLDVIAEGVESEAQLEFLRSEGCQEVQGYFMSPPISADLFLSRYLSARRAPVHAETEAPGE